MPPSAEEKQKYTEFLYQILHLSALNTGDYIYAGYTEEYFTFIFDIAHFCYRQSADLQQIAQPRAVLSEQPKCACAGDLYLF